MNYYDKLEKEYSERRKEFNVLLLKYKGETETHLVLLAYNDIESEKFIFLNKIKYDINNLPDEYLSKKIKQKYDTGYILNDEEDIDELESYMDDIRKFIHNHYYNQNKTKSARK